VRTCHYCHEGIANSVRVCPHCGQDLIHRPSSLDIDAGGGGVVGSITQRFTRFDEAYPALHARTLVQSAALFLVLVLVYGIYLHGVVTSMASGQTEYTIDELLWPLAKYCLISGAPFALLASLDPAWGSENAAPVALIAWVVAFERTSRQYGGACPKMFALFFIPLVFSALAAHTIVRGSSSASV
jgi:hypothetical protein